MKSLFTLLSALVLMVSFGSSHAQGYFGATFGQSSPDEDGFDDSTGYRLTVGYNVNPNIAFEGSYTYAGEFDADDDLLAELSFIAGTTVEDASVEIDGFELALVGKAPLTDTVSAYGKFGIFMWDADFDFDIGVLGSFSESDDGSDPFYGAGVSFGLGQQAALNLEYMLYEASDGDFEAFGAGVTVNF